MRFDLLVAFILAGDHHVMDAPIPPQPEPTWFPFRADRQPGTPTTIYINFDGVDLGHCSPSNSKKNCHWYNNEKPFEPFSGTLQTKVSILQTMRHDVTDFGIRITGQRPPDTEDYTMVVYGGTEAEYGALGSAPSGDCGNRAPNDIAFAHVDGELNAWVNGGATTALHEAAHTWGLDHIDIERTIMFPSGDNGPAAFRDRCERVVSNTALQPGDASCPELNEQHCGDPNRQGDVALLQYLYGPAYVDTVAPALSLQSPADGTYFQAPATFDVVIDVVDDLHPQPYEVLFWVGDDGPPAEGLKTLLTGFRVAELPIGTWEFHVIVRDQAGNEGRIDFDIEVGEDPPPEPGEEGCSCRTPGTSGFLPGIALFALGLRRRRFARQ